MVGHTGGVEAQHRHCSLWSFANVRGNLQDQFGERAETDRTLQAHSVSELVQARQGG